jgi:hypothetical protein
MPRLTLATAHLYPLVKPSLSCKMLRLYDRGMFPHRYRLALAEAGLMALALMD